jgi:hypothetical protein
MQKVNTQKAITTGIANLNSGAIYVGSTAAPASGATIATWLTNNAAGNMANVMVQVTPYFKSLGITAVNWVQHAKLQGMFAAGTGIRAHQLQCGLFGVQPKTIVSNKSKAIKKATLCKVGGSGASHSLAHIAQAIGATGGKIVTGNITNGNTLAMLLTGTNSLTRPHAFFGKPLVQLVVKPTVK